MALESAQAFAAYMESKDMRVRFLDEEETAAEVGFQLKDTSLEVRVFFGEDNKDVYFIGGNFVQIPADKQEKVYRICNTCNNDYRWVKFIWDEEQEYMVVRADAVIDLDTCAEECFEIVMRMAGIVDDVYPKIMKELWA